MLSFGAKAIDVEVTTHTFYRSCVEISYTQANGEYRLEKSENYHISE